MREPYNWAQGLALFLLFVLGLFIGVVGIVTVVEAALHDPEMIWACLFTLVIGALLILLSAREALRFVREVSDRFLGGDGR